MIPRYRRWERVVFPPGIYPETTACTVKRGGDEYRPGTIHGAAVTFCNSLVGSNFGTVRPCHDGRPTCPQCREAMRLDYLLGADDGAR